MDSIGPDLLLRLIDEHGALLVLYAQQWCDGPEDVVQEAIVRLMRQRPAPENVVGWLYRVVRNEAVSLSRSTARRTRHEMAVAACREPWFMPTDDDALDASAAAAALNTLPIDEREVIVLRLWSGLSFEEIAKLVDASTSTAHRRYENGLRMLRENWRIPCLDKKTRP